MLTSVAVVVCHVSVDDWPLLMVPGLAVNDAVGADGAGGGGGGGGATFLWHAPRNRIVLSANMRTAHREVRCFVFIFLSPMHCAPLDARFFPVKLKSTSSLR